MKKLKSDAENLLRSYDCKNIDGQIYFKSKYVVNAMAELSTLKLKEIKRAMDNNSMYKGAADDVKKVLDAYL